MDRRLTPANGRVAAAWLRGQVAAERYEEGTARRVSAPVADLLDAPGGKRARQLLFGDRIAVFEERDGCLFVQSAKDGYVGYVRSDAAGPDRAATHWVAALSTHAYAEPDIRSREAHALHLGSEIRAGARLPGFRETAEGLYVPDMHLRALDDRPDDPAGVAEAFVGAPYLWGGNTSAGIDCSGLAQAALLACGIPCPGDSDLQEAAAGEPLGKGEGPRRGDLVFWRGHVAVAVDGGTLVHANGHHMSVVRESAARASERMYATGCGPITSRRRVTRRPG